MKLVMTLLVRDEADIVSSNIDFHVAQGADFVIATDNLSVDGTPDILRRYERQGVLRYIHQPDDDYAQGRWVTHMARMACTEFAADWVINNDADEFWCADHGDLKQALAEVSPSWEALHAERVNFPPRPMSEGDFFADVMVVRERRSLNALGQPMPGKVCHRAYADIEVEQGNHAVRRGGHRLAAEPGPITILHYPMRSYRQFANKIAKGGRAYERNANPCGGETWRHLYNVWKKGELIWVYQASVVDDAAIERGLKDGRLVREERLKHFFSGARAPDEKGDRDA
jgi:hypothetical protein